VSWLRRFFKKPSPKDATKPDDPRAEFVKSTGNHMENLIAHSHVTIEPVGIHTDTGVQIWVDTPPEEVTSFTFKNLLWEIEPTGEYIYYLAGDFPINEKGLLRYASASTRAEVFVSYEEDAIEVAKQDGPLFANLSSEAAQDHSDFYDMTIGETCKLNEERTRSSGLDYSFIKLRDKRSEIGWTHMRCSKSYDNKPSVKITSSILDNTGNLPRLTTITVFSTNSEQKIGLLSEYACSLMGRFGSIKHHKLSGAIRM